MTDEDGLISNEASPRIQAEAACIVNAPGFAEEARRQSLLIAQNKSEADDIAFVDSFWDELFDDEEP